MYNPHLGLINAPPLILFFLQTTCFTIILLSKRPDIYKIMAKTLLIIFPPSWGDPFARIKYGTFIIDVKLKRFGCHYFSEFGFK